MSLFTPRESYETFDRIQMDLSPEDIAKVKRGRWSANVKDRNTGISYYVKGAACSLPRCLCDAVIVRVLKAEEVK